MKTLYYFIFSFFNNSTIWAKYLKVLKRHHGSKISKFKYIHKGETIFCIGAGPSLLKEKINLLDGQTVIFTNRSYKLLETIKPKHKYWHVHDQFALQDLKEVNRDKFDASFRSMHKLEKLDFNTIDEKDIFIKPEIVLNHKNKYLVPHVIANGINFSENLETHICLAGESVIFSAIQIAYYMGASQIVLLGVDMNYGKSPLDSHFDRDENQFFWPVPYEQSAKPAFIYYDYFLKMKGVKLINCSSETKEDVLEHKKLEEIFNKDLKK